jgi:hypothetical protein
VEPQKEDTAAEESEPAANNSWISSIEYWSF